MAVLVKESFNDIDFCLDPSLALYVPLYHRDGASFMSRDHYGHLCTVTGATWGSQGRTFDGIDNRVTVPDHSALKFGTGDFTCEVWVNPNLLGALQTATSKGTAFNDERWELRQIVANKFEVMSYDAGLEKYTQSTTLAKIGRWIHLCGRRIGDAINLFVNGILEGTTTGIATCSFSGSSSLYLGRYFDSASNFANGLIGEVRIYNKALTAVEIMRNYLATKWRYQ